MLIKLHKIRLLFEFFCSILVEIELFKLQLKWYNFTKENRNLKLKINFF